MLMAEGTFQLPWQVVANSFLNIKFPGQEEQKISKSRGTAIWIEEYLKMFEPDPLRYYLTAIAPERQRTAFDVDAFIEANNAILSNTLGNFVNRTLTFAQKYFDNKVPDAGARGPAERQQLSYIREAAAGPPSCSRRSASRTRWKRSSTRPPGKATSARRRTWSQRKND